MNWHVTPNNDSKPHEESTTCKCSPRVEHVNGNMVIIHNAFDGREGIELFEEYITSLNPDMGEKEGI
jgi:hypothetical protein